MLGLLKRDKMDVPTYIESVSAVLGRELTCSPMAVFEGGDAGADDE